MKPMHPFGKNCYFNDIKSDNLQPWEVFAFVLIFYNFSQQCFIIFIMIISYNFYKIYYYIFILCIISRIVFLVLFSEIWWPVSYFETSVKLNFLEQQRLIEFNQRYLYLFYDFLDLPGHRASLDVIGTINSEVLCKGG